MEGSVDAHLVDVSGKCNIKGVVRAHDRFESHGDFRILGGVMAKKVCEEAKELRGASGA